MGLAHSIFLRVENHVWVSQHGAVSTIPDYPAFVSTYLAKYSADHCKRRECIIPVLPMVMERIHLVMVFLPRYVIGELGIEMAGEQICPQRTPFRLNPVELPLVELSFRGLRLVAL